MGLSGSTHLKVFNQCYDTEKDFIGGLGYLVLNSIAIISFIILLLVNITLGYKNNYIKWALIANGVYLVYGFTLGPMLEKYNFAKKYGKKVECPKPDPNCDSKYDEFLKDKNDGDGTWKIYECDKRLMYY